MTADIYVVDWFKEVILSSGDPIYRSETKRILLAYPDVAHVVVMGKNGNLRGQIAKAHAVLRPGGQGTQLDLRAFCRQQLERTRFLGNSNLLTN